MKKIFNLTFLALIGLMVLSSCRIDEEKNTPSFGIHTVASQLNLRSEINALNIDERNDETINEILRERIQNQIPTTDPNEKFSINLRYNFDSSEFIDPPQHNSYNVISSIIGAIGKIFASIFIGINGPYQIETPDFTVSMPAEINLDLDIIKDISIDQVTLESEEIDFAFINDLKIDFLNHVGEGRSPLLLNYSKQSKGKISVINFGIQKINLIPFLTPNNILNFQPLIKIERLPPKKISFKGHIIFKITLKLPF